MPKRITVTIEAPDDFDWRSDELFQRQVALGTEARSLPHVPMRMGIFDQRVSVLPMDDPAGGARALLMLEVRNRGLSHSLLAVFESFWQQATPLPV